MRIFISLFAVFFLITINAISQDSILTLDSVKDKSYCPGSIIILNGNSSTSEFLQVQLSDPNSTNFPINPKVVGFGKAFPLKIYIPLDLLPGNYYIRVRASHQNTSNAVHLDIKNNDHVIPIAQASGFNDDLPDDIYDMENDLSGNIYIIGTFYKKLTLADIKLKAAGMNDVFLAKYDTSGNVIWARNMGGDKSDAGYGVALDIFDEPYITGTFSGTGFFGNITLKSQGERDIFVAKYSKKGDVIWAKSAGGKGADMGGGRIASDIFGNTYLAGSFTKTCNFEKFTFTSKGKEDIFISKFDQNGNLNWVETMGGTDSDLPSEIRIDKTRNIFLSGWFKGQAYFGDNELKSNGGYDAFVAKFNRYGKAKWANSFGGVSDDFCRGLVVDLDGNCFITGSFNGEMIFLEKKYASLDGDDYFVSKIDKSGKLKWFTSIGGNLNESGRAIDLDITGNIFTSGWANSKMLSRDDIRDIMIVKLDNDGGVLWNKNIGHDGRNFSRALTVDLVGNAYVAGSFYGEINFENNVKLESTGGDNLFIAKIGCSTALPLPLHIFDKFINYVVYPNPAENGVFFIQDSTDAPQLIVDIYTNEGKAIIHNATFEKYQNKIRIDLSNYKRGVFMIKIRNGLAVSYRRVMITN